MAVASANADRGVNLRQLLTPLAALAGVLLVGVGLVFLADQHGAQNLLGSIYDLLGNPAAALAVRQGSADQVLAKIILAVVALISGVGGIWLLYAGAAGFVSLFAPRIRDRLMPWVFILPAVIILIGWLVYPSIATFIVSITDERTGELTLKAWFSVFQPTPGSGTLLNDGTLGVLFNNVIWLVLGTGGSVILGLVIAAMFDRVKFESLAKTFVFLPMAISLVGASQIWRFVYAWQPPGQPQYGLLNAVWTSIGGAPVDWIHTADFHINTLLLIVIFIWLQTGFAMVILSAAIKGVSAEVLEAARLDGANERQIFFRVIVPMIKGSIVAVVTTIAIADLKIFDIVFVMTGGRFDTDVVANRMFLEFYQFFQDGRAAVFATLLFVAVLPVMYINLRNLRQQGVGA